MSPLKGEGSDAHFPSSSLIVLLLLANTPSQGDDLPSPGHLLIIIIKRGLETTAHAASVYNQLHFLQLLV